MTAFVEFVEPSDFANGVRTERIPFRTIVKYQFERYPRYPSAQIAIDDFIAVHWGWVVRVPRSTPQ